MSQKKESHKLVQNLFYRSGSQGSEKLKVVCSRDWQCRVWPYNPALLAFGPRQECFLKIETLLPRPDAALYYQPAAALRLFGISPETEVMGWLCFLQSLEESPGDAQNQLSPAQLMPWAPLCACFCLVPSFCSQWCYPQPPPPASMKMDSPLSLPSGRPASQWLIPILTAIIAPPGTALVFPHHHTYACCNPGSRVVDVVQSPSRVQLFATPWTAACQAPLSSTVSQSLLRFMSIESVTLSNLCHSLLLLPSIFSSIREVGYLHHMVKVLELQLQHQFSPSCIWGNWSLEQQMWT